MAKKLRAGIVGCGRIASLFAEDKKRKGIVTHAQAYLNHKCTELVAACDLDAKRLADFAATWGIKHTYTDSREMLKREKLDIVSVCTPPAAHYAVTREAICGGVKSIFCEKPLALSLAEADDLVSLARKHGVNFAVNHSRRWDRFEQKIACYIRSGKLGKIQTVDCYYTAGIANTGSHLIDLLRMITGSEVLSVQAFENGLCDSPDPTPDVCLRMNGGYQCFLHGLRTESFLMFEIDVYGTLGRLRIKDSGFDARLWKSVPHRKFSGCRQLLPCAHIFGKGYQDVLKNAIDNVVTASKGKGKILSTAEDGRAALEVIAAVRQSLKCRGGIIQLPLEDRN